MGAVSKYSGVFLLVLHGSGRLSVTAADVGGANKAVEPREFGAESKRFWCEREGAQCRGGAARGRCAAELPRWPRPARHAAAVR